MLREMLGLSERLMQQLHDDHEKVDGLFAKTLKASGERRAELFRELRSELEAHAQAEEKVLYKRLQKSKEEETRKFAYEAGAEHGVVYGLLDELSRTRNKAGEPWEVKLAVLQELIHHHVQEEERPPARLRIFMDEKASARRGLPPPPAGEGRGGGSRARSQAIDSLGRLPPSRPSPAGGGRRWPLMARLARPRPGDFLSREGQGRSDGTHRPLCQPFPHKREGFAWRAGRPATVFFLYLQMNRPPQPASAASAARSARFLACGSRRRLRRRIAFGVTSTSSSSSI